MGMCLLGMWEVGPVGGVIRAPPLPKSNPTPGPHVGDHEGDGRDKVMGNEVPAGRLRPWVSAKTLLEPPSQVWCQRQPAS